MSLQDMICEEETAFDSITWYFWACFIGCNFEIQNILIIFLSSASKKNFIVFLMFYKFLEQTITLISIQLTLIYRNYLWHHSGQLPAIFHSLFWVFLEESFGFKEFIFWIVLHNLCENNSWSCFTSKLFFHFIYLLTWQLLLKTFFSSNIFEDKYFKTFEFYTKGFKYSFSSRMRLL